jgi:hypothetical protein
MSHPFFEFVNKIGSDPKALDAFVADPSGEAAAAHLTAAQKNALLSGTFQQIEALLNAEVGNCDTESMRVFKIGWNMRGLPAQIQAAKAPK